MKTLPWPIYFLIWSYPSASEVDEYRSKYAELADQVSEAEALLLRTFQFDREGKGDQAKANIEKLFEMYPDGSGFTIFNGLEFLLERRREVF